MQPIGGAVIAAAGLGSRLGLGLPKCMLEIDGVTILSRIIQALKGHVHRVHVVVGYREDLVTAHCSRHHRDAVLVRNPDFRSTNTAHSMRLGARGLTGRVVFMDGDLVISQESLSAFLRLAQSSQILLGVTPSKTEQAVYVETEPREACMAVTAFTRETPKAYEWANIFAGPPTLVDRMDGFVFERLGELLPLPAFELESYEVDTPSDLQKAEAFLRGPAS